MTTPTILLHDSLNDPLGELWFAEPAGFTTLPVGALLPTLDSAAVDDLRAAAAPLLDSAPDDLARQRFIAHIASGQQVLAALRDMGTVHCAIGLHRDDVREASPGARNLLFSFFTISWCQSNVASRGVTAARAVTSFGGHTHIEYIELACGPASLSERLVRLSDANSLFQQPLLQIHAHLPHPDCRRLAVLTLSTTAVARRSEYRAILRQIAETVRFECPVDADT
ncbi:hypothetical protein DI272_29180 [Streptomyces sp. Act143]|uniref:hypothetical protein n=1 Tax=Streptomyces sp. Act143 TaxID=2200760 RepID=UPI000D674738|nr:hypothetical protein [Streptomyces sp. Act143]PWI17780.1 hypothetical protein DI272_29180 [Streptomyces sp. Act143]